jgi:transglutaminase-like putative cysteine protease
MLRDSLKSWLSNWQEWGSLVLLFLTLEIAVFSIEQTKWITPQPSLTLVLALAVLTGLILVKSRVRSSVRYMLTIVLGALVTAWQSSNLIPGQSWWHAVFAANPSEGTIHFAILLIFLTWIIGYVSTWFMMRRQNAWVAVFSGIIMVLVNLSFLTEKDYSFFLLYLLAAALLVGQTNWARHCYRFKQHGTDYARRGLVYFTVPVLCFIILATSIAWYTPEIRFKQLETLVATQISWGKNTEEHWANIFAAVPRKQPLLKSAKQEELPFGKHFFISDDIHFTIKSEEPHYWRTRAYDFYTSSGWTNSPATKHILGQGVPATEVESFRNYSEISYTITSSLKTDILLTAGEFVSSDSFEVSQWQIGSGDTIAVNPPHSIKPNEHYVVTAGISSFTLDDLSQADDSYPSRIKKYYLQLPPTLPKRVRQLSEIVTEKAESPHEKALAINSFLSRLSLDLEVEPPPEGTDAVEDFLFNKHSGFCVHFASAMVVMLRSVGVPARLCVGYIPDEWDEANGVLTLRAKHYHAWPEIYFKDYSWVEFERMLVPETTAGSVASETPGYTNQFVDEWGIPYDLWADEYTAPDKNTHSSDRKHDFPTWISVTTMFAMVVIVLLLALVLISIILALKSAFYRRLFLVTRPVLVSQIHAKICYLTSIVGLGPKPQQTPMEYYTKMSSVFPEQTESLDHIVQAYQESRFGHKEGSGLFYEAKILKARLAIFQALLERLGFLKYLFHKRQEGR